MEWKEVTSSNRYIVFDKYKEGKEKDRQYLVKKGQTIFAEVQFIGDSSFTEKKYLILNLLNEDFTPKGEAVSITPPSYLYMSLGLNPEYEQDRVVAEGDMIGFTYNGRDKNKKGEPYQFTLLWAV